MSYSIKDLREKTGLTRDAILYYENFGLIEPDERAQSGYRRYNADKIGRLLFIKNMKKYGFTLNEIKNFLEEEKGSKDHFDNFYKALENKIEKFNMQIKEASRLKNELRQLKEICKSGSSNTPASNYIIAIMSQIKE